MFGDFLLSIRMRVVVAMKLLPWFQLGFLGVFSGAQAPTDRSAMEQAIEAYRNGQFQRVVTLLEPEINANAAPALQLAADALFALHTPESLTRARHLYQRCIFELKDGPFPDHLYRRVGQIFQEEGNLEEADFYYGQLVKKFEQSFYRQEVLNELLEINRTLGDLRKVVEYAEIAWMEARDPELRRKVEGIGFIRRPPPNVDASTVWRIFDRNREHLWPHPDILFEYAEKLNSLGGLLHARELYLLAYNMDPNGPRAVTSLLEVGNLLAQDGLYSAAAFIYAHILEKYPNKQEASLAILRVTLLMEEGKLTTFVANNEAWPYMRLTERIRFSRLPPDVRARYTFQKAMGEAHFGNLEKALLLLQNLVSEYKRGPFAGLYRETYESLLFQVVEDWFAQGKDWDLDRLYHQHRATLAFTTKTRYPHMVAKAYLRLNLPYSAVQTYENLWSYKRSIRGFRLAFEEVFIDYLELLHYLRHENLGPRLREYEELYRVNPRFLDRFLWIQAAYEDRNLADDAFLQVAQTRPMTVASIFDARRLQILAIKAQDVPDYALADRVFRRLLAWPALKDQMPESYYAAKMYQADRMFMQGNYFNAKERYTEIAADTTFPDGDRDWSYLQLGRLNELDGNLKRSLRIYGQLIYSQDERSLPWSIFAERRMLSLGNAQQIKQLEEALALGEY